jgi:hypothetical protein
LLLNAPDKNIARDAWHCGERVLTVGDEDPPATLAI